MSTPSRLASSVALPSARTLKPMMIALDAEARLTLVSVTPPTPRSMTRSSDLVVDLDTEQRLFEGLDGSRVVTLEDQVQLRSLLQSCIEIVEADALATLRGKRVALACIATVGDLTGDTVLVDDEEVVACTGHRRETDDLDRP